MNGVVDPAVNYVLDRGLEEAIRVAEITERPLLLRGEPGTGKTLLAHHYASRNNLPLFRWHVKSTSQAKEGLYFYDALARLNDSRFGAAEAQERVRDIANYIRPGALGQAFRLGAPSLVLIDEIDKADIEFPNDLLLELDSMEFEITETGERVRAGVRPLVFITSNNERELPDAFLRRCIFHYIEFPEREMMRRIVLAHYPDIAADLLELALRTFYRIRDLGDMKKKPTTSELLDWLAVLLRSSAALAPQGAVPFAGALIKTEEDLFRHAANLRVP